MGHLTAIQKVAAWLVLSCFCFSSLSDLSYIVWFNLLGSDEPFRWMVIGSGVLSFAVIGAAIWSRRA